MPVPFLQFPVLPVKLILDNLDRYQLFDLLTLSKRAQNKVKEAAVRCKKHNVSFSRNNPSISLIFHDGKQLEICFNLPFPKDVKIRSGHFKGLGFSYSTVSENKLQVCTTGQSLFHDLYTFYDQLAGIFLTKMIGQLDVDVDKIKNLIGLFLIPEFAQCETLCLIGEEMEEEDAQYIQEKCHIHDTLMLNGNAGRRDQHWKMFEVRNLIVKSNKWLSIDDLMRMKCQNIYIGEGTNISDKELIDFVTKWKNGDTNKELKTLEITFKGDEVFTRTVTIYPNLPGRQFRQFPRINHFQNGIARVLLAEHIVETTVEAILLRNGRPPRKAVINQERKFLMENRIIGQVRIMNIDAQEALIPWGQIERRRIVEEEHSLKFVRGEPNFSNLIGKKDRINLDFWYRDVKRIDDAIASISILERTFKMIVWPRQDESRD